MNWISYYLGNHPRRVLLAVFCVLIPLLSYFLIYPLEIECDIRRGFANKHGHAVEELTKFSNFYNISVGGLEIWGVLARNKSTEDDLTINLKLLNEIDQLHQFVWNYTTEYKGETIRFKDLSSEDINYVFNYYRKLLAIEWMPGVNLSYPLASAFGHSFYLGSQFFGVNNGQESKEGPIKTAKFVALWYMSKAETFEQKQKLQAVQLGIFKKSAEKPNNLLFDFEMFGDQVANSEMLRGTLTTVKLFFIGGCLMVAFMACTFTELTIFSKIMLIIGAIGSPIAATGACFAILGWIGHPFNSIMCITPFLILGIGVDDAFLLLNCWRREETKDKSAKEAQNQLARVIREISPSMAITSLTNTLAFGVGFLAPTPQMSSFCLGTALAIVLDFLLEFLIFVPCMVLFYEKKPTTEIKDDKRSEAENKLDLKTSPKFSWRNFTSWLLSVPGRGLVICLYLAIFTATYLGVARMETTFDPSKTFPSDSKLVDSLASFTSIQEEYSPINFLSNVPDLQNETDVAIFDEMIRRLETREGCYGNLASHNMYRDYKEYLNYTKIEEKNYNQLENFLKTRGMADVGTIKWHKEGNETVIDLINFVVVCQGRPSWSERAVYVEKTRQILVDFPQYNITLFDYDGTIYDLIITVKGELVKSLAITFTCMTIACFVIMPSFVAPTIASVATVSISFCLIGFLSIWGQNLDPVTMIDVIMAIGFSVDYSAHVCYHYYCARHQDLGSKQEVITRVLQAVGRPVIEASLTTLLCMAPLFVVPVYMIQSFAKTVTLVTTFGLLHGLFFLPVVLYFIPLNTPKHSLPTFTPSTQPLVAMTDDEK